MRQNFDSHKLMYHLNSIGTSTERVELVLSMDIGRNELVIHNTILLFHWFWLKLLYVNPVLYGPSPIRLIGISLKNPKDTPEENLFWDTPAGLFTNELYDKAK
jgi:hypothetical protein